MYVIIETFGKIKVDEIADIKYNKIDDTVSLSIRNKSHTVKMEDSIGIYKLVVDDQEYIITKHAKLKRNK